MIIRLESPDYESILDCFCHPHGVESGFSQSIARKHNISHPEVYFANGWVGYGLYGKDPSVQGAGSTTRGAVLVSYCFIKNPATHPETLTFTRQDCRGQGYARRVRDYAISRREFAGNVVYSQVELTNPASIRSVLASGFSVYDCKDNHLWFAKVLPE